MKKRIVITVLISLLSIALLTAVLVYTLRPDIRFLIRENISALVRHADVQEVTPECTAMTIDELASQETVSFNTCLMLISQAYPLSSEYSPATVEHNGARMSSETLSAFLLLSSYICDEYGMTLYIRSSYRTAEEQQEIYDSSPKGVAAIVGASEHQSGMALDIYLEGYSGNALLKCEAGQYINSSCWQQGFILRYPSGETKTTGIVFEPWHIRYVGEVHAKLIYEEALTLDEYICDFLAPGKFYHYENACISRQAPTEEGALSIPDGASFVTISPDNTGYYIITAYYTEQ